MRKENQSFENGTGVCPVNRRRFLYQTMALAAAANMPPAPSLLAANQPESQGQFERKIKLGIVGAGGRGCWIANLFKRHGGYEMHAVADYFAPVAESCGRGLGVPPERCFSGLSGYRRLLESGVEAVALENPPCFFPEHASAAVAAGLHVYMAKPVAVDVPGVLKVEAAAKQATARKKVFLVDYQIPTVLHNIEVVKKIHAGAIGRVMALHSHYFAGQFPDPPLEETIEKRLRSLIWCNDVAIGGGYHVNACIHAIDAALWIAGQRPVSATGLSRIGRPNPHGDSHDIFELLFEYPDGLLHSHRGKHINNFLNFDVVVTAIGDTGHAQICYGGKTFLKGREDGYNQNVDNPYEAGAVSNIAKFYDCVVKGDFSNDTVARSIDGALATILGREAGKRRTRITMDELLKKNQSLEVNLKGLKA